MNTSQGLMSSLREGQRYMQSWPLKKELNPLFPEYRVIKATRFGIKVMPAVAALSLLSQLVFEHYMAFPQALVTALFALSLPLQGLWWLGRRSNTLLPPSLAHWYRELHEKVTDTGLALESVKSQPRYKELAKVLQRAFQHLDKTALDRWF